MVEFRTLLVDDEEELVTALVERLAYRGIQAEYALDGYTALIKMRDSEYDVVVLDLKLPGMGGLEVLGRMNNEFPDVPVLLLTGHGALESEPEPKPEGAFAYLLKPVQLDNLIAKMREAVKSRG